MQKFNTLKHMFLFTLSLCSASVFASYCPPERLFQHEIGETCVLSAPQRVVVLEYSFADNLGVLGEKPVGYAIDTMPEYLVTIVDGATKVGSRKAPSLEKIAQLKPDLIIADKKRHAAIYKQLSAIAPTLIYNSLRGSYDEQMRILSQMGKIYNKDKLAANAIKMLETKMEQARLESKPTTVLLGEQSRDVNSRHTMTNQSFVGTLMPRIGKINALKAPKGQTKQELSLEGLAKINPESIVIFCTSQSQASIKQFLANPILKSLKAFKNNHVYFLNKTLWTKGRGVLGLTEILDDAKTSGFLSNDPAKDAICKF